MRSRWVRRAAWVVGVVVLAASLVGVGRLHSEVSAPPMPDATPRTDSPSGRFLVAFGHIDVEQGVAALHPSQPGRVRKLLVKEGALVRAGDELLRLDDALVRTRLRAARADLKAAQRQLDEARQLPRQHEAKVRQQKEAVEAARHRLASARHLLEHKQRLGQSNLISRKEVDIVAETVQELEAAERAEAEKLRALDLLDPAPAVARAGAEVDAKQANVDQVNELLREHVLRAPEDGTVLRVLVSPGDQLGPQSRQPAVFFCPVAPRIVRAEVEQEYARRVAPGQSALVEDDCQGGGTWQAKVVRVSDWFTRRRSILLDPLQFNDVRTLECILEVTPSRAPLRIGQRVRVKIGEPTN
jgi:multidrug resistance efflux pump